MSLLAVNPTISAPAGVEQAPPAISVPVAFVQAPEEATLAAPPPPPAPVEAPAAEPPAPPPPEPEPAPPPPAPDPCADTLDWVAAAGLPLPAGVDYECPSTRFGHQGAACWDEWPCPGTAFIAINMDLLGGASTEYLRHVVAHEVCHILDFQSQGWSTEPGADACAAACAA